MGDYERWYFEECARQEAQNDAVEEALKKGIYLQYVNCSAPPDDSQAFIISANAIDLKDIYQWPGDEE
jgi:hypothetical protein